MGPAPIKTPEGQAELATRRRGLSQRHRTVLFLVDGRRDEAEIKALAAQAGAPESCYGDLLGMGLIMQPQLTEPALPPADAKADALDSQHIDLPLHEEPTPSEHAELPAVPPLPAESSLQGEFGAAESWLPVEPDESLDAPLEEARDILLRAVRAEAPVAGSLTLMRLRRARTRADLGALLDEVELRIRKPHRMLATMHTMRRVRHLLGMPADSSIGAV